MGHMRMRLSAALAICLVSAPLAAHADDALGCLLGPSDLHRCSVSGGPATVLGAIAAPVIVAGAAVLIAQELSHRVEERAIDENVPAQAADGEKHKRPNLALVPAPPDPYREPAGKKETRHKPSAAFQFNETATNVATAVTGAMVVGAVIATIVHDAHGSGHK